MPTLAEVAKVAGVGVMSVSRVVNGSRRVTPEVERRVRDAIERIGYIPNEAARVLKGTRSSVLGVVVPDLADPFLASCCSAIQETAWNAGYMTLMTASGHNKQLERREIEIMIHRRIAGLLVVPTGSQNSHFTATENAGVPVIAIDRPITSVPCDTVLVNNREASFKATEHLVAHGHKDILFILGERTYTMKERVAGYSRAMRKAKLPPCVFYLGRSTEGIAKQISIALNSNRDTTAIFAASNIVCVDVLRDLQRRQIRIPQDIALIGFDDFSAATLVSPTITVIQQPVAEIGGRATQMLLERLSQSAQGPPKKEVLATQLIIRESCGCKFRNANNFQLMCSLHASQRTIAALYDSKHRE